MYGCVASGTDRHLDITFGFLVVECYSLVSVLFREAFNHPYISSFHLIVNTFSVTCLPPFLNLNVKYKCYCLNYCHIISTIHDKDTKVTSVFLKLSPNSY